MTIRHPAISLAEREPVGSQVDNHVLTVDFCRGVLATGIMLYHLSYWEKVADVARVGYYFVYAFFVISGFALYKNYRTKLNSVEDIRRYFAQRFWRIAPLYYFALALTAAFSGTPDPYLNRLVLNLTFLFGLANPGQTSLVVGGWSIGIEMVFYLLLPFIVLVTDGSLRRLAILVALALCGSISFINLVLMDGEMQWVAYVQAGSFAFYFAAGCLLAEIYVRRPDIKGRWPALLLCVFGAAPFILSPAGSDAELVSGWTGALLMTSTAVFIYGVAFLPEPIGTVRVSAAWIARMSYPIYLLHPIAFIMIKRYLGLHGWWLIAATCGLAFLLAQIANSLVERRLTLYLRAKLKTGRISVRP